MPQMAGSSARPYRSHKIRACDLCRRRKSRCVLDLQGQGCVMCRIAGVNCCYADATATRDKRPRSNSVQKRMHSTVAPMLQCSPERYHEAETSLVTLADEDSELTRIIGPLIADDAKVVHQNCPAERESHYKVFSDSIAKPILYMKAARRRPGFQPGVTPGTQQRIIMEQILGDCAEEIIKTYFERIHPSFPILDRHSLRDVGNHHTILCEIYAISLLYWNPPDGRGCPRPDTKYFWNLAVSALQEEFSNPGLSTIPCALIDLTGRPSLWMTGNAINNGRTVALAHTIGLNRNPRKWKIEKAEQDFRIRLWWGIVIHDRWASFAHGVPPNILKDNYDVAIPSVEDIIDVCGSSDDHRSSADVFVSLCSLTEVLGNALPLVYNLHIERGTTIAKQLKSLYVDLDNWECGLPEWLKYSLGKPLVPVIPGCSNLQLSALSVRLLLHRIGLLDATVRGIDERAAFYRSGCIEIALNIVNFTIALTSMHRQDFWLPYAAYHLSSATMLLLRCSLEIDNRDIKARCISNAKSIIEYLERAKDEDDWDIGGVCLLHCKTSISRLVTKQAEEDIITAVEDIPVLSPQFHSGIDWNAISMCGLDGGLPDDFEFDMNGIWNDFCSTADYSETTPS